MGPRLWLCTSRQDSQPETGRLWEGSVVPSVYYQNGEKRIDSFRQMRHSAAGGNVGSAHADGGVRFISVGLTRAFVELWQLFFVLE